MEITILLDHDLEGFDVYFHTGFRETGWDQLLKVEFKRLRDFGLPDTSSDREIWRFVQAERLLLITNNRNCDDETSLQATIRRENMPDSLPVITVSDKQALKTSDYRERVAHSLAAVIIDLVNNLGVGRIFVP